MVEARYVQRICSKRVQFYESRFFLLSLTFSWLTLHVERQWRHRFNLATARCVVGNRRAVFRLHDVTSGTNTDRVRSGSTATQPGRLVPALSPLRTGQCDTAQHLICTQYSAIQYLRFVGHACLYRKHLRAPDTFRTVRTVPLSIEHFSISIYSMLYSPGKYGLFQVTGPENVNKYK